MKYTIVKILLAISILLITYLIIQPKEKKSYNQQEMKNIAKGTSQIFENAKKKAQKSNQVSTPQSSAPTTNKTSSNNQEVGATQQSILAVIYKKSNSTWFIKAKSSVEKINQINDRFNQLFVEELKFSSQEEPDLSHIPEEMKVAGASSMRVATYSLEGVEISISRLAGQQDTFANVKRWMGQVGLDDNSSINIDFKNDRKTIIVKMPK